MTTKTKATADPCGMATRKATATAKATAKQLQLQTATATATAKYGDSELRSE
jgi:hypothetical protein